ncbi:hypothetical protein H6F38_23005 [Paenibacillus sp. EKM208P]|nr:hypothetical protein H6F38_23005 [Paenibacillus sp. EKM208P]
MLKERVGELAEQETAMLRRKADIEDMRSNESDNPVSLAHVHVNQQALLLQVKTLSLP